MLKRFKERGIELNWDKCVFRATEMDFLGHRITESGISPSPTKINSILSFRPPENEAEIRSFLGLANYLNKFVPNLATLDAPLRELTKKGVQFVWTPQHQESFDRIKLEMSKALELGFFNKNDRTSVMSDASPHGLGAILMQTNKDGTSRVICCASKSLTDTEKRYCQTEKEALPIVWSVERFQTYLYGKEFTILTDCKALEYLFTHRSRPCARIERWVLRLQAFDYKVVHIPGEKNLADVLSRLGTLPPVPFDSAEELMIKQIAMSAATSAALKWEDIAEKSRTDSEIQLILKCLEEDNVNELPLPFRVVANELCRFGDILLRVDRIVVPELRIDHTRSEVYDHDRLEKAKGKEYTDAKRKARYSEIVIGDRVVAKRMRKDNKLCTDYSPEEFIVVRKSGGDVTIKSAENNKEYRRNVSHLKRLERADENPSSGEELQTAPQTEGEQHEGRVGNSENAAASSGDKLVGTKRIRKEPAKYKDYLPH